LVERIGFGLARGIGKEREGGIHDPHVVDEEDDDIGLGGLEMECGQEKGQEEEQAVHGGEEWELWEG
jgi:hypothetical protein